MSLTFVSHYVVVADAALYHTIPCPHAARLLSLRAVTTGSAFTLTLYNRAFTTATIGIQRIEAAATKTQIVHKVEHPYRVGDQITVASSSVSGYNALHVVTSVVDAVTVITDQTYSAEGKGGTSKLDIQSGNFPLYEIIETTSSASIQRLSFSTLGEAPVIVNMDAEGTVGQPKQIYAKFSATGTYRITLGLEAE
jgi:hypothetical protein